MLQLFIDAANRDAAEPLLWTCLFAGGTAGPLLRREGPSWTGLLDPNTSRAFGHGAHEVFFQAAGTAPEEILRSGRRLADPLTERAGADFEQAARALPPSSDGGAGR